MLRLLAITLACDASAQSARLANISTRGQVGTGADTIFGGFVIAGGPKTVLVRAVGPGLAAFGMPGTPVAYTATVSGKNNSPGVALFEIYELP